MRISPAFLLWTLGALLAVMLSFPILRLCFLGYREGLTLRDVLVMCCAWMLLASLFALALMDSRVMSRQRDLTRALLEDLGEEIQKHFDLELDLMNEELDAMSEAIEAEPSEEDRWAASVLQTRKGVARYPFFEMAFWMDGEGMQVGKWSAREQLTGRHSLASREYFQAAMRGDFFCARESNTESFGHHDDGHRNIVLQSISSLTSGRHFGLLAKRVDLEWPKRTIEWRQGQANGTRSVPARQAKVAAIEAALLSVIDPILPPGTGFAICKADGEVVFNSRIKANLIENLFEEVDPGEVLRGLVHSRTQRTIGASYRALPVWLHTRPLVGTPWMLVTHADRRADRAMRVELLAGTLAFFGATCIGLLLILAAIIRWVREPPRPGEAIRLWFWPVRGEVRTSLTVLAAVVLTWGIWWGRSPAGLAVLLDAALLVLLLLLVARAAYRHAVETRASAGTDATQREAEKCALRWCLGWLATGLVCRPIVLLAGASSWLGVAVPVVVLLALRRRRSKDVAAFLLGFVIGVPPFELAAIPRCACGAALLLLLFRDQRWIPRDAAGWQPAYLGSVYALLLTISTLPVITIYTTLYRESLLVSAQRVQLQYVEALAKRRERFVFRQPALFDDPASLPGELQRGAHEDVRLAWTSCAQTPKSGALDVYGAASERRFLRILRQKPSEAARDVEVPLLSASWVGMVPVTFLGREAQGMLEDEARVQVLPRWKIVGRDRESKGDDVCAELEGVYRAVRKILLLGKTFPRGPGPAAPASSQGDPPRHHLLIGAVPASVPKSARVVTHEQMSTEEPRSPDEKSSSKQRVLVEGVDQGLDDPAVALRKVRWIEHLVRGTQGPVELHCSVDPLHAMTTRDRAHAVKLGKEVYPLHRWAAALQTFHKDHGSRPDKTRRRRAAPASDPRLAAFLDAETRWDPVLPQMVPDVLQSWAEEQVRQAKERVESGGAKQTDGLEEAKRWCIEELLDRGQARLRYLWTLRTVSERALLQRVARHGMISWRHEDLVKHLVRTGLLILDPSPRLVSETLRRFAATGERVDLLEDWRRELGATPWARIRTPLVIAIVCAAAFFFVTQRNSFEQTLGLVAALATGAPLLLKLAGLAVQDRVGGR